MNNSERLTKMEKYRGEIKGLFVTIFITFIASVGFMLEYNRSLDPVAAGYGFIFMLFIIVLIAYLVGTMLNFLRLKNREE